VSWIHTAGPTNNGTGANQREQDFGIAGRPKCNEHNSRSRDYVYIEASSIQENAAVAFELRLKNGDELFRSDLNEARLRIDRSGYYRAAIRIPHGLQRQDISEFNFTAFPTQSTAQRKGCRNASISKVMILDEAYVPGLLKISGPAPQNLPPDGLIIYRTKRLMPGFE